MRDLVKAARGKRSQECIANQVGISQNHLSNIESGIRRPSVKVAKRIAAVLGIDWTEFFQDEKEGGKR